MRTIKRFAMTTAPLALMAFATPAAAETYHGFANPEHYVIQGGVPATISQLAQDPLSVFRSNLAYAYFRAHMSSYLGQPVTDEYFRSFMGSGRVRLVDCDRPIDTAGISDSGDVKYGVRDCYNSSRYGTEQLIQIQLGDGSWITVGSLWCVNPVTGEIPILPIQPVTRRREYQTPSPPRVPSNPTVIDGSTVLPDRTPSPSIIIFDSNNDCCC